MDGASAGASTEEFSSADILMRGTVRDSIATTRSCTETIADTTAADSQDAEWRATGALPATGDLMGIAATQAIAVIPAGDRSAPTTGMRGIADTRAGIAAIAVPIGASQ